MTLRQIRGLARSRATLKSLATKAQLRRAERDPLITPPSMADYRAMVRQVCWHALDGPVGDAIVMASLAPQSQDRPGARPTSPGPRAPREAP